MLTITLLHKHKTLPSCLGTVADSDEPSELHQRGENPPKLNTNKCGCLLDYINIMRNVFMAEWKIVTSLERVSKYTGNL